MVTNTREYMRNYRKKNRKRIAELFESWKEENPDYFKDYFQKRKVERNRPKWLLIAEMKVGLK